ncbi:uncharacterized protein LOC142821467 [Pelodiscus sinensis]|uniref:uncharacterized protein LOC142821467 n=1 Tax=Pelodiscus sinensis TaxID=13735 RepID=UPI003F6C795A
MAQALAAQGHPAQTLEQVRAKVKDLWLSLIRASESGGNGATACLHYHHLHSILANKWAETLEAMVDSALATSVVQPTDAEEEEEGNRSTEEEEEDGSQSPPAQHNSHHVSQASSEIGEGSSEEPSASEGPSSPILPAPRSQGSSQRTRDCHYLLHCHVCTIDHMEHSLMNKTRADEEWWERVWGQYIEHCDRMYALLGTIAECMGPAPQHSVARPPPIAPPALPNLPHASSLMCPCPILWPPNISTSWCSLPQPSTRGRSALEPGVGGGGRGLLSHP